MYIHISIYTYVYVTQVFYEKAKQNKQSKKYNKIRNCKGLVSRGPKDIFE